MIRLRDGPHRLTTPIAESWATGSYPETAFDEVIEANRCGTRTVNAVSDIEDCDDGRVPLNGEAIPYSNFFGW